MDPANSKEALIESALDQYEGADIKNLMDSITTIEERAQVSLQSSVLFFFYSFWVLIFNNNL